MRPRVRRRGGTITPRAVVLVFAVSFLILFFIPTFMITQSVAPPSPKSTSPVPTRQFRRSQFLDMTPPLSSFIATKNPSVSDEFRRIFGLPADFIANLKVAVQKSPENPKTGNRMIMFTIFDIHHLSFALNLLCSSRASGLPPNYHIFIAMDERAHTAMKQHCPNVILCDVSDRKYEYEQFCKVKLFIQYQLLLWKVESVICDDDLVILENPMKLFREDSHFEFATECQCAAFGPGYNYDKFNVGFMRVIPTKSSILTYEYWIKSAIPNHFLIDQDVFQEIMKPLKITNDSDIQVYKLPTNDHVVFRYYDPTDVMNGGLLQQNWTSMTQQIQKRRLQRPFVVHAAWVTGSEKYSFLNSMGLWFLRGGRCNKNTIPRQFPSFY